MSLNPRPTLRLAYRPPAYRHPFSPDIFPATLSFLHFSKTIPIALPQDYTIPSRSIVSQSRHPSLPSIKTLSSWIKYQRCFFSPNILRQKDTNCCLSPKLHWSAPIKNYLYFKKNLLQRNYYLVPFPPQNLLSSNFWLFPWCHILRHNFLIPLTDWLSQKFIPGHSSPNLLSMLKTYLKSTPGLLPPFSFVRKGTVLSHS